MLSVYHLPWVSEGFAQHNFTVNIRLRFIKSGARELAR